MTGFVSTVFLLALLMVVPAFVACTHSFHLLKRYLREKHPVVWARIAPPPLAQPTVSAPHARFVTQRTYRSLGDPVLDRLGDRCFARLRFAVVVFLVLFFSGLAFGYLR